MAAQHPKESPLNPDIHGLWPALLLPMDASGALDTPRAIAHAQRMLQAGCDGVTLFGTTGEGPAFTMAERKALLESLLGAGVRADQVVVTTTTLALDDAIELGRHASRLGVHRQMLMPPFFFNQPKDAGIVEAVSQVVRGIGDDRLKLLLYHFPAMSTFGFSHAAIAELVKRHPGQVVGVKDSSGDLAHSLALAKAFPQLAILVGAEPHVAPVMCEGGSGSINGLANIAPRLMKRVMSAPAQVAPADAQLILDLLQLLSILPGMPFVGVYKAMLAEQTGDNAWLHMRAPLSPLDNTELQSVRSGYRAITGALSQL
ncbi:dihydrodipicolinate synthase family protein [Rhodoferax saidenbachensis]|uniref:Dihydrodipicolinate synthase family protein n=1 Tax=Rhodoferax saidenbachensis TaxID=1484693 RepID=A0A1P8KBA5_9BURK|nr:dihydrodipicolinate synthase family protein [Rhodoferax saidenbachensis]